MKSQRTRQKFVVLEDVQLEEDAKRMEDFAAHKSHVLGKRPAHSRQASTQYHSSTRVTAYCTAESYHMPQLYHFFNRGRWVELRNFDDCIYARQAKERFAGQEEHVEYQELFIMSYGVVVTWGYLEREEDDVRAWLKLFEIESLDEEEIEVDEFKCTYEPGRKPKIFNDVIFLQSPGDVMTKLAISLAIGQSAKLSRFEWQVAESLEKTQHIPHDIEKYGDAKMSREDCIKAIGFLFDLRTHISLGSSILATPEIFWTERARLLLYETTRNYLEISQRAKILGQRVDVVADMLDMLNNFLTKNHGESLEWIVIILVFISVVLAGLTIFIKIESYMREKADAVYQ